ncbi:Bacteriophage protein gp37 [hydrothermal vent metagenome]|uniref:Bacteriophage protein gp37 n=1 Tax=hydrothermal vent metagenome TaxID=652676 RepID=A0A3B0RMB9_9ZZZZ
MKKTKIEWTEATWNPTTGCTKVSAGCKNCYAETMSFRLKAMGTSGYENGFQFSLMPERLVQPLNIKKATMFFVNSMSDLFHEDMPFDYLNRVFDVIEQTPHHQYQILTKRENILNDYFSKRKVPKNVWLGVTVENKKSRNRIDILRNIDAEIRFLSLEPLLEDLGELDLSNIHWAIVGGESGHKARPMKASWAINIKEQCKEQNVAFFFKQWGTWGADNVKRSKKANGRLLEGEEWNEYPAELESA